MNTGWSPWVSGGWLAALGLILMADLVVRNLHNPRVPTLSRVLVQFVPWWVTVPAVAIFLIHIAGMYWRQ